MPFLIQCNNKNCFSMQAAKLDVASNEVICADCGNPIQNVTIFAKTQLKSLGQTTKRDKAKQSFAVNCNHCKQDVVPKLENDIFICDNCKKELNQLTEHFKMLLKSMKSNGV